MQTRESACKRMQPQRGVKRVRFQQLQSFQILFFQFGMTLKETVRPLFILFGKNQ